MGKEFCKIYLKNKYWFEMVKGNCMRESKAKCQGNPSISFVSGAGGRTIHPCASGVALHDSILPKTLRESRPLVVLSHNIQSSHLALPTLPS